MTPGARVFVLGCGHISHIVKIHYFFKNHLLYSGAWIKQSKYMYILMMTKEGSTKIVNFMTTWNSNQCSNVYFKDEILYDVVLDQDGRTAIEFFLVNRINGKIYLINYLSDSSQSSFSVSLYQV